MRVAIERSIPTHAEGHRRWLLETEDGRHWLATWMSAECSLSGEQETLIFRTCRYGHVACTAEEETAGGVGMGLKDAMHDLEVVLDGGERVGKMLSIWGDLKQTVFLVERLLTVVLPQTFPYMTDEQREHLEETVRQVKSLMYEAIELDEAGDPDGAMMKMVEVQGVVDERIEALSRMAAESDREERL